MTVTETHGFRHTCGSKLGPLRSGLRKEATTRARKGVDCHRIGFSVAVTEKHGFRHTCGSGTAYCTEKQAQEATRAGKAEAGSPTGKQ